MHREQNEKMVLSSITAKHGATVLQSTAKFTVLLNYASPLGAIFQRLLKDKLSEDKSVLSLISETNSNPTPNHHYTDGSYITKKDIGTLLNLAKDGGGIKISNYLWPK